MAEIYVSTDVEADGPIPGPYSMLSFGSAAYRPDKHLLGTFTANLEQLPAPAPTRIPWPGGQTSGGVGRLPPGAAKPREGHAGLS